MRRTSAAALLLLALVGVQACSESDEAIAVGTLERDRIDLIAEASEPVVERPVEEGAWVEAGALLVALDPARLQAQVAEAAAARAGAAAHLAELVRGPRQERISEARARLKGAEGRLVTARSELARTKQLVAQGVASLEQRDLREAAFEEALAARDAWRATLQELRDGTTDEELAQAKAALAQADAALANAQLHRDRLEVRAPTAGWVDALPFELGERPPAGGVVAVLMSQGPPYARVYVPAAIRVHVKPGTPVKVRIDGIDEPLPGRVRMVATEASFTPYFALTERDRGRLVYPGKIDLLAAEARELPSGIPVEVEFQIDGSGSEASDVGSRD